MYDSNMVVHGSRRHRPLLIPIISFLDKRVVTGLSGKASFSAEIPLCRFLFLFCRVVLSGGLVYCCDIFHSMQQYALSPARRSRDQGMSTPSSNNMLSSYERNSNFKVAVRVRPPLPRELSADQFFKNVAAVQQNTIIVSEDLDATLDENGQLLPSSGSYNTYSFVFDHVYDQNSTQKEVYENTAKAVVDSALQGFNATIIAYGQTGTGYTVCL